MLMRPLKSHALLSVVVLSFVVSIMLSAAIGLAYTRSAEILYYKAQIKGYRNVQAAQEYFFSLQTKNPIYTSIDLYNTGSDSVFIQSIHWGLWEAVGIKATTLSGKFIEKNMLVGCVSSKELKSAVWLPLAIKGLGLTGTAKITGDCYLAEGGVKTNMSVAGFASSNQQQHEGKYFKCDYKPIPILTERLQLLLKQLKGDWSALQSTFERMDKVDSDTIFRSFTESTLCISLDNLPLNLSSIYIKGNCILYSSKLLRIPATAQLHQVQIIAPAIIVESGYAGSIHILASDSILVKEKVTLSYPSSLVLVSDRFIFKGANIQIQKGVNVSGVIYACQLNPDGEMPLVCTFETAKTVGNIYTNGAVELKGTHIGNVTTNKFLYTYPSSIIVNVMPQGLINYESLSAYFVQPNLMESNPFYKPACWIEK